MEFMKEKMKKASKISLTLFVIAIAILVIYGNMVKDETIEIPTILAVYLLITTAAALICALISFVLDAIESIKKDKFAYVTGLLGIAIVYFVGYVGIEIFLNGNKPNLQATFIAALIFACISRTGKFLYEK